MEKMKIKFWWIVGFFCVIIGFFANGTLSTLFLCVGGWTLGWNIAKYKFKID